MKWLSRVPENIKEAKMLILKEEDLTWETLSDGYSYHINESNYGGVKQRWALIFSKQAYTRDDGNVIMFNGIWCVTTHTAPVLRKNW
jgi:hypothetical protein